MGFFLFVISYVLFLPLSIINFIVVENKNGYFRSSAITIDKLANREFRTLWNKYLKTKIGYKFGAENETISSALGKNLQNDTLSRTGEILVSILTKKHCIDAINNKQLNINKQ